ncbi:hypothetical protein RI543_004951 [Arxiozyma heterogenica]|uniref:Uncharacterized protein n=1 Tax=Arxiozyma heterogenica TaxID=278026 RepID=A0AAN7WK02_9SACH|nr:hypothetical protein RI543_004951 [Kazachstania heterogenica]
MGRIVSGHKSQDSPNTNMLKSSESMNKWKIPHYYKRFSNNSPNHHHSSSSSSSSSSFSATTSTTTNNNNHIQDGSFYKIGNVPNMQSPSALGIINSPKRIVLESRPRNKSVSSVSSTNSVKKYSKKKNKNDMVFVNYTVQDNADNKNALQQLTPSQSATEAFKNETVSPIINEFPQQSQQQQQPFPISQKLYRKRMLKIFGSSKHQKSVPILHHNTTDEASVALERSLSGSNLYNSNGIGKKSYNAFLKYDNLNYHNNDNTTAVNTTNTTINYNNNNNSNNNNKVSISENTSTLNEIDISNMEYVPKSKNDPTLAQPPTTCKSKLILNSMNTMTQYINRKYNQSSTTTKNSNNNSNTNTNNSVNNTFTNNSNNNNNIYNNRNNIISRSISVNEGLKITPNGLGQVIPQYIEQKSSDPKAVEDNDASVAFSKLISKKRTDINTSPKPLIPPPISGIDNTVSSTNNMSGITISKPHSQRTASVTSLPSNNSRYSPLRTQSPARPRSSTRGSSMHRLSRDVSTIYSPNTLSHDVNPLLETDTFLDSQFPTASNTLNSVSKRVSVLSSGSSTNANKIGHRRKQESISDNYKFISTFSNGTYSRSTSTTSVTTPNTTLNTNSQTAMTSSGLLLTPPYVTPSLTQPPNSLSTVSTPSGIELYNLNAINSSSRQTAYTNHFQQGKQSNDISDALTDFAESLPLVKTLSKEPTNANMNNNMNLLNSSNNNEPNFVSKNNYNGTYKTTDNNENFHNDRENGESSNVSRTDAFSYFTDSNANSSGAESVMANILSTTSTTTTNSIPQNFLINDNKTTAHLLSRDICNNNLFHTINNLNEDHNYKHNNIKESMAESISTNNNNNNNNNSGSASHHNFNETGINDEQLLEQLYLEFNFENPDAFLQEHDKDNSINKNKDKNLSMTKDPNQDVKIQAMNHNGNEQIFIHQMDSTATSVENFSTTSVSSTVLKAPNNNTSTNSVTNLTINNDLNATSLLVSPNHNNKNINLVHDESNIQNSQLYENNLIANEFNDLIPMTNNFGNDNMNDFNSLPMNHQDIDRLTNYFFDNMQNRTT